MSNDFTFQGLTFKDVKKTVKAPVAASVRKSSPRYVNFRIDAGTAKICKFSQNELLTPFVDLKNRAVLLLAGQRPVPVSARKLLAKDKGRAMDIDFPRVEGLADLFPIGFGIHGMDVREQLPGRLMFVVPAKALER